MGKIYNNAKAPRRHNADRSQPDLSPPVEPMGTDTMNAIPSKSASSIKYYLDGFRPNDHSASKNSNTIFCTPASIADIHSFACYNSDRNEHLHLNIISKVKFRVKFRFTLRKSSGITSKLTEAHVSFFPIIHLQLYNEPCHPIVLLTSTEEQSSSFTNTGTGVDRGSTLYTPSSYYASRRIDCWCQ
ncbi:hypothetical protein BDV96DRAFT_130832 [Lophiotrema nucula]|uniref:Uncharacterized protein n=1 Tax=Lophiotrema nucula TaxID=690887 RepID=A0A6A5ZU35_9PLEO|nr:hypothetical protein BDV96DRAFT_130832 [Lophiotrema nucula]